MSNFIQGYQLTDLVVGARVVKSALALPQNATATLFTVSNGSVLVTNLVGLVTTAFGATATNLSLGTVPTTGTAETSGIANATAVASLAAGTWVHTPLYGNRTPTTPSVPLTTVNQANNNPYSVSVTITGGTLTSVKVNGVQVGTTDGTYTVPSYGTISITYSVAPTWAWANARALVTAPGGGMSSVSQHPGGGGALVIPPGTITWTTSANDTGNISWYLNYLPLDQGGTVS